MVNAKQKRNMIDFLVGNLETAYSNVRAGSTDRIDGEQTNYITVGRDSAVILVDRPYVNGSLKDVRKLFRSDGVNVATVFYSDGEDFFRSAAKENGFKMGLGLSLKNYKQEQINRMVMFRPEEIATFARYRGKEPLQYYHPGNRMLGESLVTLDFKPVKFDYSHIPGQMEKPGVGEPMRPRFVPENTKSKRLYIWNDETRKDVNGDLRFSGDFLVLA